MHNFSLKSGLTLCAATSLSFIALSAEPEAPIYQLEDYIVSTGPTARAIEDFAIPTTALDETALRREAGGSLGELLDGQLGVSASSFAAGASRPIIRGFDGPRVRILDSGIEALDVSDTSPDHAVSVEPLLVERVEILRGPATLLYGSSAIGGVVNVVGRELPRSPVDADGYEGTIEASYDSASKGKKALGYTTVGGENWALSLTGLTRDNRDYKIPVTQGGKKRLENSFVETDVYSAGGTWFFAPKSYFGLSYSGYESLYGVAGDEDVSIDLRRDRFDGEFLLAEPTAWIDAARLRFGYTDYAHTELEGAATGTLFEREGWELRGEIAHHDFGVFDSGIVGIQLSDTDVSAQGDEAFTPPSTTRNQALFTSQHIHGNRLNWEFGARAERQSSSPESANPDYSDLALSLAASAIWKMTESQQLSLSVQRSQRHPNSTELYASGPHLATEQYELGDDTLGLETAYGIDFSYRYKRDNWSGSLSTFYTYFEDYVFAQNLGFVTDPDGNVAGDAGFDATEAIDTFQFAAVDATFWGFEGELEYTIYHAEGASLSYRLFADYVRAQNDDNGNDLPRVPPLRVGAGLRWISGDWDAGALLRHSFEQEDTAVFETKTDGYTELSLDMARSFTMGGKRELTVFAKAGNLLNEEIRHHTSFLKDSAPMPGRSLTIGARYDF